MTPCGTLDDLEIVRTSEMWSLLKDGKNKEVQTLEDVCNLVIDEGLCAIKYVQAEMMEGPKQEYEPKCFEYENRDSFQAVVLHFISMILDDEVEVEMAGKHFTDFAMKGFVRGKGLGNIFRFMFHFMMHKNAR